MVAFTKEKAFPAAAKKAFQFYKRFYQCLTTTRFVWIALPFSSTVMR